MRRLGNQPTHTQNDEDYRNRYIQRVGRYCFKTMTEPDLMVFSDSDQEAC